MINNNMVMNQLA